MQRGVRKRKRKAILAETIEKRGEKKGRGWVCMFMRVCGDV